MNHVLDAKKYMCEHSGITLLTKEISKENYDKLVEFVKRTSIDIVHSEFMADKIRQRALKLLTEIGEIE